VLGLAVVGREAEDEPDPNLGDPDLDARGFYFR